jgi:hypothetical protein
MSLNGSTLLLCLSDPIKDPRPFRKIKWLKKLFSSVTLMGEISEIPNGMYGVPLRPKAPSGLIWRFWFFFRVVQLWLNNCLSRNKASVWPWWLRDAKNRLRGQEFDLIVCEDLDLLPLALSIRGSGSVLFDAREFYARQFEDRPLWRYAFQPFADYLCRTYLSHCDHVLTVSPGLQRAYQEDYGVKAEVMMSLPEVCDLLPNAVDPSCIRLIYHGNANPSRSIEEMLNLVDKLDTRFIMDFMVLPQESSYVRKLKTLASRNLRIRFISPQPMDSIIPFINAYDLGVFFVKPKNFNLHHCLPNKLFEYIQARLAIAIGPSPDMKDIVENEGLGIVGSDWSVDSLAAQINALDATDIFKFKKRAHAVSEHYSSFGNMIRFGDLVKELCEKNEPSLP